MIPSGVEVYVASTPVDFRKGPVSLMALVRDGGVDPFNGALYVFRSKPVFTRATRTSVCRPPVQWMSRTASLVFSSRSQTISRTTM